MNERVQIYKELVQTIVRMGYPESFGKSIANNLRTEKAMTRMIGYLRHARPRSAEEIVDEMLAIMEDRICLKIHGSCGEWSGMIRSGSAPGRNWLTG